MTQTPKRTYFNLAMQQELHWLEAIVLDAMRPIHVALVKLAIRKKGGAA